MTRQLWFDFAPQGGAYRQESFCQGRSNAQARRAINLWREWGNGVLYLHGPVGCGKSHLAHLWLDVNGGQVVCAAKIPLGLDGNVVVENLESGLDEEGLFHLINRAMDGKARVLLTARQSPRELVVQLGDLRSRLLACEMACVEEPDDDVLECMLRKLFADRSIRVDDAVIRFLVIRMERSSHFAFALVEAIHARSMEEKRPVRTHLAKEVLEELLEKPGLLEFMEAKEP